MPKVHDFTEQDFLDHEKKMWEQHKFRSMGNYEFSAELIDAHMMAPTARTGREKGLIYSAMGYEVIEWTSWLEKEKGFRRIDTGKVIIRYRKRLVYQTAPMHRTKNYFINMEAQAKICSERIRARPLCPKCRRLMFITCRGNYQYYWKCLNPIHEKQKREKIPCAAWDTGLSAESLNIVNKKRKWRRDYSKKRVKQNKPPYGTARQKKKKWKPKDQPIARSE
jgi:hypothetical protein